MTHCHMLLCYKWIISCPTIYFFIQQIQSLLQFQFLDISLSTIFPEYCIIALNLIPWIGTFRRKRELFQWIKIMVHMPCWWYFLAIFLFRYNIASLHPSLVLFESHAVNWYFSEGKKTGSTKTMYCGISWMAADCLVPPYYIRRPKSWHVSYFGDLNIWYAQSPCLYHSTSSWPTAQWDDILVFLCRTLLHHNVTHRSKS